LSLKFRVSITILMHFWSLLFVLLCTLFTIFPFIILP
jgi:hypothetical protein